MVQKIGWGLEMRNGARLNVWSEILWHIGGFCSDWRFREVAGYRADGRRGRRREWGGSFKRIVRGSNRLRGVARWTGRGGEAPAGCSLYQAG